MKALAPRTQALANAPLGEWAALSADETRLVAHGKTFEEAAQAAEAQGESDPVLVLVPREWTPIVL